MRPTAPLALLLAVVPVVALASDTTELVSDARATVDTFRKKDGNLEKFLTSSAGYVVFPTVGKGGFVVGGAGGSGVLFEKGVAVGKASLGQVTVGLQLGGQTYSEIVFFEDASTLSDFKHGNFALAAQASAVALSAGAAATAKYQNGVAIFTMTKTGLMYEASVGGQKFGYEPFGGKTK